MTSLTKRNFALICITTHCLGLLALLEVLLCSALLLLSHVLDGLWVKDGQNNSNVDDFTNYVPTSEFILHYVGLYAVYLLIVLILLVAPILAWAKKGVWIPRLKVFLGIYPVFLILYESLNYWIGTQWVETTGDTFEYVLVAWLSVWTAMKIGFSIWSVRTLSGKNSLREKKTLMK